MLAAEAGGVGKPGQDVAEGADGELDQDVLSGAIVVVGEDAFLAVPDLDAEADVEAFGAGDAGALVAAFEEDVAGVDVAEADAPFAFSARGEDDAGALVEIVADVARAGLRGDRGFGRIGGFLLFAARGCGWLFGRLGRRRCVGQAATPLATKPVEGFTRG